MLPEGFEARMRALLGSEYEDFLASFDRPLCTGLRRNPLKTGFTGDLSRFSLSPVPWCPTGFYYAAVSRPGLSPYHAAGFIICRSRAPWPRRSFLTRSRASACSICARPRREIDAAGGQTPGKGASGLQRDQRQARENSFREYRAAGHFQRAGPERAPEAAGRALRGVF